MNEPHQPAINDLDPHGFQEGDHDHGHVILPLRTLVLVLAALLFFTVLTISAGSAEVWISEKFDVVIPTWVNVMVAMSIATIKGMLVLMYFMQLKYDNPLNTIIFLFCLFAFALFMGLTAIDLGNRDRIYAWKAPAIIEGGNSVGLATEAAPHNFPSGQSIATWAREREIATIGPDKFAAKIEARHPPEQSSSEISRPARGRTPGLFDTD